MPILLEVNAAAEASKFGYQPDQLLADLLKINALPKLEIHGLMTIPPFSLTPERSRGYFKRLRELREKCEQSLGAPLVRGCMFGPILSMGMSGDFEVAIEEGSTMVRIGTALFGERSGTKTGDREM